METSQKYKTHYVALNNSVVKHRMSEGTTIQKTMHTFCILSSQND